VTPRLSLSPNEAAVLETFVVPRYLSLLGELALELLAAGEGMRMVHLGCRTGYPDRLVCERWPGAAVVGVDASRSAIDLARNKAALQPGAALAYHVGTPWPSELEAESFSNALVLHPIASARERPAIFAELARLLYTGGQALVALPLRGSFLEVGDLFREYALKHDQGDFGKAVDAGLQAMPSIETLAEELEAAGLDDIDVEIRATTLGFDSGRGFAEDAVTRLLIAPALCASLGVDDLGPALGYLKDAIDKYFSETRFDLAINVGCASAWKP
jgi:SAM-dependent methyltransferase